MKNLRIISFALCLALVAFLGYTWSQIQARNAGTETTQKLIPVSKEAFGVPFTLTNHLGETVTEKTYAGQYRLLYFGFTYCPAVCPTGLQKISAALKNLGAEGDRVQPIFITVDPERDSVKVMKSYVEMFHPKLVGYTGTPEQITPVLKGYKIYASKVEDPDMSDYTMDHSAFTYLIGPEGNLLHIFKHEDKADDMTKVIRQWLAASPG